MYGEINRIPIILKRTPVKFSNNELNSCGVYAITCIPTGLVYIGSSNSIKNRWTSHKAELNSNTHTNEHLQNAWNMYGSENFNFSVLEFCEPQVKFDKKQYYIDTYQVCDRKYGFNIAEIAGIPTLSPESRQKQSESLKRNTKFIETSRQFLKDLHSDPIQHQRIIDSVRNSSKAKENLKKLNASPEHKAQVQRLLQQVHNDPRIQEIVKNLAQSNITKNSWRQAHGVYKVVQLTLDNKLVKIWNSLSEAENSGFSRHFLTKICKKLSNTNEYKGFKWMYLEDYNKLIERSEAHNASES